MRNVARRLLVLGGGAVLAFLHVPIFLVFLYAFTTEEASFQFPPPGLHDSMVRSGGPQPRHPRGSRPLPRSGGGCHRRGAGAWARWRPERSGGTKFFGGRRSLCSSCSRSRCPGIITGIALRSAINLAAIPFSFWTLVIGHATFCVAVAYNNVIARMRRTSPSLMEASMDLGASGWQTFRYVLLPQLAPALVTGGMLAFALSFDEIIVTTFTAGQQQTLPIWIFSSLVRPRQRPVTNVVAVLVVVVTFIPIILSQRFARRADET